MEDVETFMLLQVELYLKVVPLDWIFFSVILGYLTDEDNEIHMLSIPSNNHSAVVQEELGNTSLTVTNAPNILCNLGLDLINCKYNDLLPLETIRDIYLEF